MDWFRTLALGSISSFAWLKNIFLEYFAGSVKIKKDPMELSSTKECEKKTLCQWYERFSEVAKEIEDITSH